MQSHRTAMEHGKEGLRSRTMYLEVDIKLYVRDKGSDTHQRPASKYVQYKATKCNERRIAQRGSEVEQCIWRLTSNWASEIREVIHISAQQAYACSAKPQKCNKRRMTRTGSEVEQCIWRLTSNCASEIREVICISAQQVLACSALT